MTIPAETISLSPQAPSAEFLEELAAASRSLESAAPEEIIRWAVERYHPKLTMATAFGPEGCVILYMLSKINRDVPVFNLDTGYQFQETLDVRDRIAEKYGIEVELKQPKLSVEQYEAAHGGPVYNRDPNQCCFDRKVTVLREAAQGWNAWMTAIRRDQSPDRATAAIVGWDKKFNLVKVNPLANWTKKDVWRVITTEDVPYNPLHDQGYPSIGCWPCTRAVAGDDDERAGRWQGFAKTECGLHTQ
jgi:phosphoadenosine phosphosulfate reductase